MNEQLLFPVLPYRISNKCSFPCLLEPCQCLEAEDDKVLTDIILKSGRIYAPLSIPSATLFPSAGMADESDVQKKKQGAKRGGRGRGKTKENIRQGNKVNRL